MLPTANLRPRERLQFFGPQNLTDQELIALILGTGSHQKRVLSLAKLVLQLCTQLRWKTSNWKEQLRTLSALPGFGLAQSTRFLAAQEWGSRFNSEPKAQTLLDQPESVFLHCQWLIKKAQEHAVVLYLNGRLELIHQHTAAIGGSNFSFLEAKEVLSQALILPASHFVLVHNHPSGDPTPSEDDVQTTKRLLQASELLGVTMIDHVVVASQGFRSLRQMGYLDLHPT